MFSQRKTSKKTDKNPIQTKPVNSGQVLPRATFIYSWRFQDFPM